MSKKQPETRCTSCGYRTRAKGGVCRGCRPSEAPDRERGPVALTGGRWVPNGRGIVVWKGAS